MKSTMKFLCSYGGKILPRPSDGRLRYVGGHTRILSVNRSVSYSDLIAKLSELCGYSVTLRCQLPSEDLDLLVTVKSDEDLANLIEEYDRASLITDKELKIRAILSPPKSMKFVSSSSLSSSSSSSAGVSPKYSTEIDQKRRRSDHHRSPVAVTGVQNGVFLDGYYRPCHVQANFRISYLALSNLIKNKKRI